MKLVLLLSLTVISILLILFVLPVQPRHNFIQDFMLGLEIMLNHRIPFPVPVSLSIAHVPYSRSIIFPLIYANIVTFVRG